MKYYLLAFSVILFSCEGDEDLQGLSPSPEAIIYSLELEGIGIFSDTLDDGSQHFSFNQNSLGISFGGFGSSLDPSCYTGENGFGGPVGETNKEDKIFLQYIHLIRAKEDDRMVDLEELENYYTMDRMSQQTFVLPRFELSIGEESYRNLWLSMDGNLEPGSEDYTNLVNNPNLLYEVGDTLTIPILTGPALNVETVFSGELCKESDPVECITVNRFYLKMPVRPFHWN